MARVEVITGPERRRRWSEDQKRAIVAASFAPGAVVSDVARRADISAGQIYRWRQELRADDPGPLGRAGVAGSRAHRYAARHEHLGGAGAAGVGARSARRRFVRF